MWSRQTPRLDVARLGRELDRPPDDPLGWVASHRVDGGELPCAPWDRWVLVALHRHVARQAFVERVVRERLSGDPSEIGSWGAFEHPDLPEDIVPGLPDWRFLFHGRGCCLTHADGTELDVDFDEHGSRSIDPWFYDRYLETVANPGIVETHLRTFGGAWKACIQPLVDANLLEGEHRVRVSETAIPWCERASAALDVHGAASPGRAGWLGCLLEDYVWSRARLAADCPTWLRDAAERQIAQRGDDLELRVAERRGAHHSACLAALDVLQPHRARALALRELAHGRIDGVMSRAVDLLARHMDHESTAAMVGVLGRLEGDAPPHPHLRVTIARHVLTACGPEALPSDLRSVLLQALRNDQRACEGDAALLTYLLDEERGLRRLVAGLNSGVPVARTECAAGLAMVGNASALDLLRSAATPEAAALLAHRRGEPPREGPAPEGQPILWRGKPKLTYRFDAIRAATFEHDAFHLADAFCEKFARLLRRWTAS